MPEAAASSKSILVVGDPDRIRPLVTEAAQKGGYHPVYVASGQACLAALETMRPAVVLLELDMPGMGGDECCRRIRELLDGRELPVIILTGESAPHQVMACWRAGATDFLPRAFEAAQLQSKLDAALASGARPRSSATGAGPRVLLVEPSRFHRNVLGHALENAGYRLLYAKDAEEAKGVGQQVEAGDPIAAIVAELTLVGSDGIALVEALRQLPAARKALALIMSGADVDPDTADRIRALTGKAAVDKRLPVDVVVSYVNATLKRVSIDLRVHRRLPFFSVVEFRAAGTAEWSTGFSYDVSSGGIFVRTLTPAAAGQVVELRFGLAVPGGPISKGVVVWANGFRPSSAFTAPPGMGVRFSQVDPDHFRQIEELMKTAEGINPPA